MSSLSHIGCKSILGHLLFSSHMLDSKNICLLCTRMNFFEEGCGSILDELDEILISDILENLPVDQVKKGAHVAISYCHLSLNYFIKNSKINPYNDWYRKVNFPDMNYLGAKHLLLIHNHILTISIRVFFNVTYNRVITECNGLLLCKSLAKVFVSVVKELVKQFFVHLKLEGAIFYLITFLLMSINKNFKKMSSKLLSCIRSRFDHLITGFHTVWLEKIV